MKLIVGLLPVIMLAGCVTNTTPSPTSVSCSVFKPIRYKLEWTEDYKLPIKEHNLAYCELCGNSAHAEQCRQLLESIEE
jgi:hypothetical protein